MTASGPSSPAARPTPGLVPLRANRLAAWSLWALAAVLVGARIALYIAVRGRVGASLPSSVVPTGAVATLRFATAAAAVLAAATVGVLIATRRPRNLIGWGFLTGGALTAVGSAGYFYALLASLESRGLSLLGSAATLRTGVEAAWVGRWAGTLGLGVIGIMLLLLFPDGRLPRRAVSRVLTAGAFAVLVLATLETAFGVYSVPLLGYNPHPVAWLHAALGWRFEIVEEQILITELAYVITLIAAGTSLVVRFTRSRGETRQQMKWLAAAGAICGVAIGGQLVLLGLPLAGGPSDLDDVLTEVFRLWFAFALVLVPVATGVAIFKHRLYDIDLIISRGILFGTLAVFVTVGYAGLAVGVATAVTTAGVQSGPAAPLTAMVAVAVAFEPVRARADRFANRLVFGERATPYETLSSFTRRTAEVAADEVLPRMAEETGRGLDAERVEVRVILASGTSRSANWSHQPPRAVDDDAGHCLVPVFHAGVRVGSIELWKRHGEPATTIEDRLVRSLAEQAGTALRNVALTAELEERLLQLEQRTEELRRSQRRLVTAHLRVRENLETELRARVDGKLAALEHLPDCCHLTRARELADATLEELRAIVRGVFPPLLAERGIVDALEGQARREGFDVEVEASVGLRRARPDPGVEAVAYFCCMACVRRVHGNVSVGLDEDGPWLRVRIEFHDGAEEAQALLDDDEIQDLADHVEALAGRLDIRFQPNHLPALHVRLPMTAAGPGHAEAPVTA